MTARTARVKTVRTADCKVCTEFSCACRSMGVLASTGDRCARRHDMERAVHHVCVEGNRPEVLERRRLREIDGIACLVDVDDLAIGAGSERHPGASLELHLVLEPFARKINGPELVMTNLLDQDVSVLAVWRERKADFPSPRSGADRKELDALLAEIDPADDEQSPLRHGIFHAEQRGEVAGLVVGLVHRAQIEAANTRVIRQRQIPRIDLLAISGVVNQNLIAKYV